MKKILILANSEIGLYKFRKELLERLIIEKYCVYICSPYGIVIKELERLGCIYINTKIERHGVNIIKEINLVYRYYKIIKNIKPAIVLTFTVKPNIYGGILSNILKIPYIATITGLGSALEKSGILQKLLIILYKRALGKAKYVFFQNEENINFFLNKKIVLKKYGLVPGSGVNIEYYYLLKYPEKSKNIEFAFISRIMKEKGIDQYLEAAKNIKAKYNNTIFHVCGDCEESYDEILFRLQEKGIIIYHGTIEDTRKILERIHCVIHPTYYAEGMSNILLESASCGRPAITTNRSGCKEIVDDGINGFIVKNKNSKDLIKKIENFLKLDKNEMKNMGIAGRKKVEQLFNRKSVVDAYVKEVFRVIKQKEVVSEKI